MMKKILLYCFLIFSLISCKKEPLAEEDWMVLVGVNKVETIDKYELAIRTKQDPNGILFKGLPNKKIKVVSINYWTLDPQQRPIIASGAIFYPSVDADYARLGTILGLHYTLGANYEAPSVRMGATEGLFSLFGYCVVVPDYIGYGATSDSIHPYYCVENTGQVSADMLLAAKEYFASISRKMSHKITVLGYSQGGQASLCFLKFVETDELYKDAFVIDQVFAGGGAYDLVKSYDEFVLKNYSSQPVTIPLLVLGLDYGDNLQLDIKQCFKEPLLSHYKEWVLSKKYTTDEVSEKLDTKLTNVMADSMYKKNNPNTMKFLAALAKNSLIINGKTTGWAPKAKVTLLHGTDDTIVPYANTKSAYEAFLAAGCNITLHDLKGKDHKDGGPGFYSYCILKLMI
jgi:pimeloyl-ACP methyl ester carboxylesterase